MKLAKILLFLFALPLGLTSVARTSTYGETVDGIDWYYQTASGLTTLTGAHTPTTGAPITGAITIPSTLGGRPVRRIGYSAFSGYSGLTSVTIPDSVTLIEGGAFSGCSSLTSVTIPNSVTRLGLATFAGCTSLTSVTIPDSVTSIPQWTFEDCTSLTSVTIPDSVTDIGIRAFYGCSSLTSVTIPDSVTRICGLAFCNCSGLTSVTIPDSVTSIEYSAFNGCSSLTGLTIPNSVTSVERYTFSGCSSLTSVTIGNSVTSIDECAFSGCSGLTSLTIPDSVTSIEYSAFSGCNGLTSLSFKGAPPSVLHDWTFSGMAPGARGYYTAEHAVEWNAVIVDGKWKGLIMEEVAGEKIYRVRLHGNGALTEQGEEWVDLEEVVGKGIEFPEGVFTQGKWLRGDLSGWLQGWWPVTGVYDGPEDRGKYLWKKIVLEEKDISEWKAHGWMEDIEGVPTVHFYAIWKSEIRVGVHGAYGQNLAPPELEEVVKYLVRQDDEWRTGGRSYSVLPGEQGVVVELDSGYGGLYKVTMLKEDADYELKELAPYAEGTWFFDIPSTEGPQKVYLQIRVEPKDEMGSVWFKCSPEMTDAQRSAREEKWGEKFPEFDEGKVQIRVRPAGATGNGMAVGNSVALPEGKYRAEIKYTEMAGDEKSYWDTTPREGEIEVRAGKTTEINVVFRPFGSKEADYSWIVFDGDGGTVKGDQLMWFTPNDNEYPNLFGFHFPSAVRAGGWKFEGWWYPPQEKLAKTWQELWWLMISDFPGNLTLKAQWKRVENAATSTGTVVPHEWLASTASATLTAVGGDYEAAAAATAANGMAVWECYVAGLDPEDKAASFKAELVQEEEKWKAKPVGGEKEGRVYRVKGKRGMVDAEDWTDVTDVDNLEAEGWHFFRIGVELAE